MSQVLSKRKDAALKAVQLMYQAVESSNKNKKHLSNMYAEQSIKLIESIMTDKEKDYYRISTILSFKQGYKVRGNRLAKPTIKDVSKQYDKIGTSLKEISRALDKLI